LWRKLHSFSSLDILVINYSEGAEEARDAEDGEWLYFNATSGISLSRLSSSFILSLTSKLASAGF